MKKYTATHALLASLLLASAVPGGDAHARRQTHKEHDAQHQTHEHKPRPAAKPARKAAARYVCPMHPDVVSARPGNCPECGMFLKAAGEHAAAAGEAVSAASAAPSVPAKAAPASADYFPNHVLLTQDNKPVRFYDDLVKGKVVLINFMFTTCTGVCPPMASNMAKVQQYLGDRVGRDVVLISISVDPTVDTPDKLKRYAAQFRARPGWYFLTGEKQNVEWVLYKLGGYVEDKMQHSGVLIIGNDATGEWIKTAALRNPAHIAEAVNALLKNGQNSPPAVTTP